MIWYGSIGRMGCGASAYAYIQNTVNLVDGAASEVESVSSSSTAIFKGITPLPPCPKRVPISKNNPADEIFARTVNALNLERP